MQFKQPFIARAECGHYMHDLNLGFPLLKKGARLLLLLCVHGGDFTPIYTAGRARLMEKMLISLAPKKECSCHYIIARGLTDGMD